MKVLVIGNGAREHALVCKVARSPHVDAIYAMPGNAGTDGIAQNIDISSSDIPAIIKKAQELHVGLVVVGPEAPLAAGITDRFQQTGVPVFGPSGPAARLESSKAFARELMVSRGIPCAAGREFTDYEQARSHLEKQHAPIVVKADGLAAGKGVTVANTIEEAMGALDAIMKARIFGAAGDRVIIEECLVGREVSLLAFSDGKTVIPMVPACDYKRIFDGDAGPNTGGMGSYSPPGFFTEEMVRQVTAEIIKPVIDAMAARGSVYKGVLYTGLIITDRGPKVLEFNARFGDPETQVILPRLQTDLVDIMLASINGTLDRIKVDWSDDACVGVVLASGGYPGEYRNGQAVSVSDKLEKGVNIYFAGAKKRPDGRIVTDGGRVLTVAATGKTLKDAREKVYRNIPYINFKRLHYRTDIAAREVN